MVEADPGTVAVVVDDGAGEGNFEARSKEADEAGGVRKRRGGESNLRGGSLREDVSGLKETRKRKRRTYDLAEKEEEAEGQRAWGCRLGLLRRNRSRSRIWEGEEDQQGGE